MVFLIGIAGDFGTGKTSFAEFFQNILKDVAIISLNDYRKYDREACKKFRITPLNPRANKIELMLEHLERIKKGEKVVKPVYNREIGKIIENAEDFHR
jgi:phosphoribulokinase